MPLNLSNSSNLERLVLEGLILLHRLIILVIFKYYDLLALLSSLTGNRQPYNNEDDFTVAKM